MEGVILEDPLISTYETDVEQFMILTMRLSPDYFRANLVRALRDLVHWNVVTYFGSPAKSFFSIHECPATNTSGTFIIMRFILLSWIIRSQTADSSGTLSKNCSTGNISSLIQNESDYC